MREVGREGKALWWLVFSFPEWAECLGAGGILPSCYEVAILGRKP